MNDDRKRVDLHRLPVAAQYVIALVVVGIVVALAWHWRSPVPGWVSQGLVPALGWIGLFLIVTGTLARLWKRRRDRRGKH